MKTALLVTQSEGCIVPGEENEVCKQSLRPKTGSQSLAY